MSTCTPRASHSLIASSLASVAAMMAVSAFSARATMVACSALFLASLASAFSMRECRCAILSVSAFQSSQTAPPLSAPPPIDLPAPPPAISPGAMTW